jgi:hypothetical protein
MIWSAHVGSNTPSKRLVMRVVDAPPMPLVANATPFTRPVRTSPVPAGLVAFLDLVSLSMH